MSAEFRRNFVLLVMAATSIPITIIEVILHVGFPIICISVVSVLLGATYAWRRSRSTQSTSKRFSRLVECSLILFVGAIFGVTLSLKEGWRWVDLWYVGFPFAFACFPLWYAFKIRRSTVIQTPESKQQRE